MKKLTHTLALSTILLGALSPTGQAIADTVLTQSTAETAVPTMPISTEESETDMPSSSIGSEVNDGDTTNVESKISSIKEEPSKTEVTSVKSVSLDGEPEPSIIPSPRDYIHTQGDPYGFFAARTGSRANVPGLSGTDWTVFSEVRLAFGFAMYDLYNNDGTLGYRFNSNLRFTGKLDIRTTYDGVSSESTLLDIPIEDYQNASDWSQTYADSSTLSTSIFLPTLDFNTKDIDVAYTVNSDKEAYITDQNFNTVTVLDPFDFGNEANPAHGIHLVGTKRLMTHTQRDVKLSLPVLGESTIGWGSGTASEENATMVSGPVLSLKTSLPTKFEKGSNIKDQIGDISSLLDGDTTGVTLTWAVDPTSDQLGENHGVILATGANGYRTYLNFVYEVVEPTPAAPVAVKYVDETNQPIPGYDTTITGVDGEVKSTDPYKIDIPTYTLDDTKLPASEVRLSTTEQSPIVFVYKKNQGTVTVKYQDDAGNPIQGVENKTYTGPEGFGYNTASDQIKIPGYILDTNKLPSNVSGQFTAGEQSVVYIYFKDKAAIVTKPVDIYVGDDWKPEDNFVSLTDSAGNTITNLGSDVTVDSSQVDTNKVGDYTVTYFYTDSITSTKVTEPALVHVRPRQTAVNVHNSKIYVGDNWKAEDNFDSALDKAGNPVNFSDVTVDDSQVDTSKVGTYNVTYTYDGVTSTSIVQVVDKSAILVHDSTLTVGDTWTAQDNFDSALNKKGDKVPFDQIKVDGEVDTNKAGTYKVTYTYDETNSPQVMKAEVGASHQGTTTVTATITVKDKAPVAPGNPDNPGEPTTPTTPGQPDQPNGSDNTSTNTSGNTTVNVSSTGENSKASNKTLPDTGEENNVSLIASGLGMLLALLGLILFRETKQKREK